MPRPSAVLLSRLLVSTLLGASLPALAACQASSGEQRTILLELYTSQGCSSCPPAERWLSRLPAGAASRLLPLAFHVDYWDYLGWRDAYADAAYSARQRHAAQLAGSSLVYTPQLLLDGRDRGGWQQQRRLSDALAQALAQPPRAALRLRQDEVQDGQVRVSLQATLTHPTGPAQAYVALFQSGLSSRIAAGENAGANLRHDYVVRQLYGPFTLPAQPGASLQQVLSIASERLPADAGLAAWVQDPGDGSVLQALQLMACR